MDEEARFWISAFMTSRLDKGYRTCPLQANCNEFTMKEDARNCGRLLHVLVQAQARQDVWLIICP